MCVDAPILNTEANSIVTFGEKHIGDHETTAGNMEIHHRRFPVRRASDPGNDGTENRTRTPTGEPAPRFTRPLSGQFQLA